MKKIFNYILCGLLTLSLSMQTMSVLAQTMTYDQYMQSVVEKNVSYLAEKYNIDIATANLQAAKVFNDPELSVEYGNNQDWYMQMGQSLDLGLSYDLDLGGVRRARIRSAKTEREIAEASVAAYLSNLRMEAAEAWAEAWKLQQNCQVLESSVNDMMQIAKSDSIRLSVGDIGRTDAMQSKLEAQTLEGELIALQAEYHNALMALSYMCGGEPITGVADEQLPQHFIPYTEDEICRMAEANRADLKEAELSHTLSENNLKLVRASRRMEMNLSLGYSYNTEVRNEIAPAPKFNGLSVGVAIPLKFSNFNRGERRAAENEVSQAQKYYEAARMQVHMEAAQAYNAARAATKVLQKYDENMLQDAKDIVESRKVGYQKGETSLIELLTAQQTYRDVMQAYIEACSNQYVSQAQLAFAIGIVPEKK